MPRLTIIVIAVVGLLWTAVPCRAADAPAYTARERKLAEEFQTSLEKKKVVRETARSFATTYLRRAYAVPLDQAQDLAADVMNPDRVLSKDDREQFFAWGLDALIRGTTLADVLETNKVVLAEFVAGGDKTFFMEQCLKAAGPYSSGASLAKLAVKLGNDGLVGQRRRDGITWMVEQIGKGEDAAKMLAMREAISKHFFAGVAQLEQIKKYYGNIQQGIAPDAMITALQELAARSQTDRVFNDNYDKIIKLYASGKKFDVAVKTVLPPPKEPKEKPAGKGK